MTSPHRSSAPLKTLRRARKIKEGSRCPRSLILSTFAEATVDNFHVRSRYGGTPPSGRASVRRHHVAAVGDRPSGFDLHIERDRLVAIFHNFDVMGTSLDVRL